MQTEVTQQASNTHNDAQQPDTGVVQIEAASVREGLNEVRRILGAEAIILSQQHFPNGVHIWATQDMTLAAQWQAGEFESTSVTAEALAENAERELESREETIEIPPVTEPQVRAPLWHMQAAEAGYPKHLLDTYAGIQSLQELRRSMSQDIQMHQTPGTLTGRMVFLGLPGSGKTTFLLKQLVASLEYQSSQDIAVVNCDQHRLGGGETIGLACQIFGVDNYAIEPTALADFLPTIAHKKLVLIDTSGQAQPAEFAVAVSRVWVVSAHLHPLTLDQQWRVLSARKPDYVALSHCDDIPDADDLLRRLFLWRLPLLGINRAAEFAVDLATIDGNIL